ncbi:aspartic proteinase CDR1-like [Coffea arabica]|uniref:Aspartic proteinase CDR1-like n=1 Tax=Coffea arabica TaxID=13443 RepID=A0A6P6TV39_COFAR|nr:aspartic proteinase CDR1-like [Coffea arabica]
MAAKISVFCVFSTLRFLVTLILISEFSLIEGKTGGFSVDLIHRDTQISPFHDPSKSHYEQLNNAFHRSFSRAAYFKKRTSQSDSNHALDSSAQIQSYITSKNGEYLMKVSIGTPPVDVLAIADTGSDLTWTQCKPCSQCYKQDAPFFDPHRTSTYREISCESASCAAVGTSSCDDGNNCEYRLSYGDNSYSIGSLGAETFTFKSSSGKNISIQGVVFGCGHQNDGTFNETASGIVGLGGGAVSIVTQLSKSIGGRFSYCLTPLVSESNVSSKIKFGNNAVVLGSNVVSTPLIKKNPDTFYFINLEGISVADKQIAYKNSSSSKLDNTTDEGNIIIDSGTTLTFVPQQFYDDLQSTLKESINGKQVSDPNGLLGLCYQVEDNIKLPNLVVHFTGADVVLPPTSTFIQVSEGTICLTFVPSDDIAIFGNLSQMNFLIGYDLINQKLSFLPVDCTKY